MTTDLRDLVAEIIARAASENRLRPGNLATPVADEIMTAIAATGRLLPDGGTTEVQHRYRDPDGFTKIGLSSQQIHDGDDWRLTDRRTVTHWPDGRWHFAPWEAVDDYA